MMQALMGAILFLWAAIWETHVAVFLPSYAAIYPLWALVVVCLCLEANRLKLAAGLVLALAWQELARPASMPSMAWLWVGLMVGASWLLQIWLSHRSMWSAVLLAVFGRLVWIGARLVDIRSTDMSGFIWQAQMVEWLWILIWDVVLVVIFLRTALFLSRRLSPYLPRFSRRDHV